MGINELIDKKVEERLKDEQEGAKFAKKKQKRIDFNYFQRSRARGLLKKSIIPVIYIKRSKVVEVKFGKLESGMLLLDGKYYNGDECTVLLWKGKMPIIITCEWSINPIAEKPSDIDAEQIIIRMIEYAKLEQKKPLGNMWLWIGVGIVAIIAIGIFAKKIGI